MIMLFYTIKKDLISYIDTVVEKGTFTYHEFKCGWGGTHGFTFGDVYKTFNTHAEALSYAQEHGGIDVYSY